MAGTGRGGLSQSESVELWRRWRAGASTGEIGRELGRRPAAIYGALAATGGFTPVGRRRRPDQLGASEREEISRGIGAGHSMRRIGRDLGRSASTISREIGRNGGRAGYRAVGADARAGACARRPKPCLLAIDAPLRRLVAHKLARQWSPQQISGWLKERACGEASMRISPETIYKSLFIQARGVLKKELLAHLRSKRMIRRGKTSSPSGQGRGQIVDAVSIRERPAGVEDRAIPGHWEGDLLSGAGNTHIATLVERASRFALLVKVDGKDSQTVVRALIRQVGRLPEELRKSLTWDRGLELAFHRQLTAATDIEVYFCDPRSPWQRGSNENTNGLLRQYLPKGTDLSVYSQDDLNRVALRLNTRPRKTLGYQTPADTFRKAVALTG